jgi:hypothetical protein
MMSKTALRYAIWLSGPVEDGVQHVNGYPAFGLAKWLEACFLLLRDKVPLNTFNELTNSAAAFLDLLLHKDNIPPLDVSRDAALALREVLRKVQNLHSTSPNAAADEVLFQEFSWAFMTFDNAFQLELARLPVFYVTQKGVFDTRYLIVDAAAVYVGYRDRLSKEAIDDTNQAGRCLAFNLPTAAGFHIARATESTIKVEMAAFDCPPPTKKDATWAGYTEALKKTDASKKVIQTIDEIRRLHRNPLIHPEVTLTLPEAVSLWAICTSAIQAMVADMETRKPQPSAEIVNMLPSGEDGSS